MNFEHIKHYLLLLSLLIVTTAFSQTDICFRNGFEKIKKLNDTGIIWAGDYPSNNNIDCNSNMTVLQDCNIGRDSNGATNDNTDGHAGFNFTKLDSNGQSLSSTALNWTCVKDNVTGLVWEVKTNDSGIHDKINTYQWGGLTAIGRDHPNRLGEYYDSWNNLVQESNDNNFCGFSNWRVPNIKELSSIINKNIVNPAIDENFFPNTVSDWYWSSAPIAGDEDIAWFLYFNNGYESFNNRNMNGRIRLVRTGI